MITFSQTFAMPTTDKASDERHVEHQEGCADHSDDDDEYFGHVTWTHFQVTRFRCHHGRLFYLFAFARTQGE